MRSLFLAAIALLLPVSALPQASGASVFQLTDRPDDATLQPSGLPSPVPNGAELRGLTIAETTEGFVFALDAGDLGNANEGPGHTAAYRIHLRFNDAEYQLVWIRFATLEPALQPSLRASWRNSADEIVATLDWETPFEAFVARGLIADSTGNLPALGSSLEGIYVESVATPGQPVRAGALPVTVTDRMPDTGVTTYPVQSGPLTVGTMRATANQAYRSSNGGADTFVYLLNVTGGTGPGTIVAESLPDGWTLYAPEAGFATAASTVPVMIETSFAHSHGQVGTARLRLSDGVNVARVDIGINYLQPPRPDGHHSTLYFHSGYYTKDAVNDAAETVTGFNFARDIWFNSLSEDAADEKIAVSGPRITRDNRTGYGWFADLSPQLRGGLHVAGGTGAIEVPLRFPATVEGGLYGNLSWVTDSERVVLATIAPEETITVPANQVTKVRGVLTAEGRRLDLAGVEGTLQISLLFESASMPVPAGPGASPAWEPGGFITVPLYDYSPPVQDELAELTGIRLSLPADVSLRPGSQGVLRPQATPDQPYRLDVVGELSNWTTVQGNEIIVTVPNDAAIGDFGEIVVRATAPDDPLAWALARVRVHVDEADSLPAPPAPTRQSSFVGLAPLALSLMALLALTRKRNA